MGYESAPGTLMLASYCAACSKELLDAASVEAGMGPSCRKMYKLPETLSEETRAEANQIVHEIACRQVDSEETRALLTRLDVLGCTVIAERIRKRLYGEPIEISLVGETLRVKSDYDAGFVGTSRAIRSRRWDAAAKLTTFSVSDWVALEAALYAHYSGARVKINGADPVPLTPGCLKALCGAFKAPVAPLTPPTPVKVVRDATTGRCSVSCPYDAAVVAGMKTIEGRRWDAATNANTFPIDAEDAVLTLVRATFSRVHVVTVEGEVDRFAPRRMSRRGRMAYRRAG